MSKVLEDVLHIGIINACVNEINTYLKKNGINELERLARIDKKEEYFVELQKRVEAIVGDDKKIVLKMVKNLLKKESNQTPTEEKEETPKEETKE